MVRPPVSLVALLLAAVVLLGTVPGAPAQETPTPPAVDNTVTRVALAADGSARWTVTIRTRLDSAADVRDYEAFQDRFRENTSRFLGPFESRISSVVASAAEATGRPMSASAFAAETRVQEVPRRWGIVEYAFTWSAFAATEGDAVVAGDAFVGGFFLSTNDTLVVVVPPEYALADVRPAPDDRGERSVAWTGREDFADGRPLVRAEPTGVDGGSAGGDGPGPSLPGPAVLGGAAVVLLALAGLAALGYRRRTAGGRAGASTGDATSTLTDEERVMRLLEERGGRVPQAAVVEAFDWSTSKTSRLLGRMAEEGTIEKLQLGRENLIRLPPEDDDG